MFDLTQNSFVTPFLRWAGGKQLLLHHMSDFLPVDIRTRRYIEPFGGAASMLLAIRPHAGILSDANEALIRCYGHVRDNPERVANYLLEHLANNCEAYYYQMRTRFNSSGDSIAQAARFIYLNKACFNGIYRVNKRGDFNVPYGHKEPPALPTKKDLILVSQVLENIELYISDYKEILEDAREGDFVYLDPPYPPLNGTSRFTHYTTNGFSWNDHMELLRTVDHLSKRGCLIMMSNADHPRIREQTIDHNVYELDVIRYVTCKNIKHKVKELIITNY